MRSRWIVAHPKLIAEAIKRTESEVRKLHTEWQIEKLNEHHMSLDVEQTRANKRLQTLNALYALEVKRKYKVATNLNKQVEVS